ncbi:hypothetical protein [Streptomyces sp. NPDC005322]|uniref:hypothetical protein n=1 Tax=unclassified Streptomyces TaxID=2593676 RepID=UPI0033B88A33
MPHTTPLDIRIGVYATEDEARRLGDGCGRVLDGHGLAHRLSVAGPGEPTAGPGSMPLAAFYDDLPEQWRIGHPGEDPGARAVHEVRVALHTTRPRAETLREELTRVVCPDPEHRSPCPVPWASHCVGPTA